MNWRNIIHYLLDIIYGATKFSCGWFKPNVVRGYFYSNKTGHYQRLFFNELLRLGFKRTYWQLIFPNQTAGLVKKIPVMKDGTDEYHIRFYSDGIIDCELEVNRFNGWHWAGKRRNDVNLLNHILKNKKLRLSEIEKTNIKKQFGTKNYTNHCLRVRKQ